MTFSVPSPSSRPLLDFAGKSDVWISQLIHTEMFGELFVKPKGFQWY